MLAGRIQEALLSVREHVEGSVEAGIILGSGLGDLADAVTDAVVIPYREIPHFPVSTVAGHAAKLVVGRLEGRPLAVFQGRLHYYEGYSMEEVTFPVRLMRAMGASIMIVTNAVGGLREDLAPGDLVTIRDHINCMGTNPLRGQNDDTLGPRFPKMDRAYDEALRELARRVARELGITLKEAVYAAVTGPSYETRAEIHFMRTIGTDTVGMSTVPETIVARHAGMRVAGISCVTNVLHGDYEEVSHEEVLEVARQTAPSLIRLMRGIIAGLPVTAQPQ